MGSNYPHERVVVGIAIAPLFSIAYLWLLMVEEQTQFNGVEPFFYEAIKGYAGTIIVGIPLAQWLMRKGLTGWRMLLVAGAVGGAIVGLLALLIAGQFFVLYEMQVPLKAVVIFTAVISALSAVEGLGIACLYGLVTRVGKPMR